MSGTISTSPDRYLAEMGDVLRRIDPRPIERFADVLFEAWQEQRRVFVFGNGGSAYTASHHVCDLVKTAAVDGQRRLRAFSLVDNTGITTAVGNDINYDQTFSYPLASYAEAGDIAVAISCSGNSPNVLRACEWASQNGLTVVALTGFAGGKVKDFADIHINVPHENYGIIEDLHLSVGHMVAQMLKSRVAATGGEVAACES